MFKEKILNKRGFTYLELIIVIAVTVILTTIFVVSTQTSPINDVNSSTSKVISDIRYARSLATSRTISKTDFPVGGYGIQFTDGASTYVIFGDDNGNGIYDGAIIDTRVRLGSLDNTDLELEDANQPVSPTPKRFVFKSENEVETNFVTDENGLYTMAINYNAGVGSQSYKGLIFLGELADDGKVFVSLGLGSQGYEATCSYLNEACDGSQPCCSGQNLTCTNNVCKTPPTNPPPVGSCFPAGTTILMADGSYKNIEDVVVGEYVLSYDSATSQQVAAEVLEIVAPVREHMCEVIFEDDSSVQMTDEHPVFTDEGWKAINPNSTYAENENLMVEQLTVSDKAYFSDGIYKEIIQIDCWKEVVQTYNLKSVDRYATFFADDVLVHNALSDDSCGSLDPGIKQGVGS